MGKTYIIVTLFDLATNLDTGRNYLTLISATYTIIIKHRSAFSCISAVL